MTSRRRIFAALTAAVVAGVVASLLTMHWIPKQVDLSTQELIAEVQAGYVHEVVITDGEVLTGISSRRGRFRVALHRGDKGLADQLTAMGVDVKFETEPLGLI